MICLLNCCVPQNRNFHILKDVFELLSKSIIIKSLTTKYFLSGYSCVQEVENMQKQIEGAMEDVELYSSVSLVRALLRVI